MSRVDRLLIGGAMMFTFLRAMELSTGRSLVEEDRIDMAKTVLDQAKSRGVELVLPQDCLVSTATDGSAPSRVVPVAKLGPEEIGVDIGPATVRLLDRKSTRLNSSHSQISYAVFCLKKKQQY